MERIIESCRLAVNLLLATILYQIPIGVTAILTLNAVPLLQSGLIVAGISIVVLVLFIIGARKNAISKF